MNDISLPDYAPEFRPRWPGDEGGFTAAQMRLFAREAVAAERERIAQECWERRGMFASDLAARAFADLVREFK